MPIGPCRSEQLHETKRRPALVRQRLLRDLPGRRGPIHPIHGWMLHGHRRAWNKRVSEERAKNVGMALSVFVQPGVRLLRDPPVFQTALTLLPTHAPHFVAELPLPIRRGECLRRRRHNPERSPPRAVRDGSGGSDGTELAEIAALPVHIL